MLSFKISRDSWNSSDKDLYNDMGFYGLGSSGLRENSRKETAASIDPKNKNNLGLKQKTHTQCPRAYYASWLYTVAWIHSNCINPNA